MSNNHISTFESNFRIYSAIYDGMSRDELSETEEKVVDALYATEMSVVTGEKQQTVITLPQLKKLINGYLKAGKKCDIQEFKPLDDTHVQYKVHITTTGSDDHGSDKCVESIATIKDGKIIAIEPFSQDGTARVLFEIKFRDYFALYDGTPKDFGEDEEEIFNAVFSDNFSFVTGDMHYSKSSWMEEIKAYVEVGFDAEIVKFKFFDNSTELFEYKLRFSGMTGVDTELHSVGTIKDGKLISIKPFNDKAYQRVFHQKADSFSMKVNVMENKENKLVNA
jgi:hypothetical protein